MLKVCAIFGKVVLRDVVPIRNGPYKSCKRLRTPALGTVSVRSVFARLFCIVVVFVCICSLFPKSFACMMKMFSYFAGVFCLLSVVPPSAQEKL